jgi:hypothetical protein
MRNEKLRKKPFATDLKIKIPYDESPDISYLQQEYEDSPPEEQEKYKAQDAKRLEKLERGDWSFIGIRAECRINIPGNSSAPFTICCPISSSGLWGIEDDSGEEYLKEVALEQVEELLLMLRSLSVVIPKGWSLLTKADLSINSDGQGMTVKGGEGIVKKN